MLVPDRDGPRRSPRSDVIPTTGGISACPTAEKRGMSAPLGVTWCFAVGKPARSLHSVRDDTRDVAGERKQVLCEDQKKEILCL